MALGHIEWTCEHGGCLRLGGENGEDYWFSCHVHRVDRTTVKVLGVVADPFTPTLWRGIDATCSDNGFETLVYERRTHGRVRSKRKTTLLGFQRRKANMLGREAEFTKERVMSYSNKQALADVKQAFSDDVRPKTNPRQAVKAALVAIADDIEAGLDAEKALNDAAYKAGKAAIKARRAGINAAVAAIFAGTE